VTRIHWTLLAAFLAIAGPAGAEQFRTEKVTIEIAPVATGLENPWAVEVLPDGAYIVTERPGRVRIIRDGKLSEPLEGLPEIAVRGQGGLLDVALSPDFSNDRTIFLTAALRINRGAGTGVIRARLSKDERSLEEVKVIFRMKKGGRTGRHFGSRIVFAKDGSLFFSIGERGEMNRAQDFGDHAGSILRIAADGSVPQDNPYADGSKALPEIYSKGHRNAQGLILDPLTDRLLTVEHGAMGGDEVNLPKPGSNYGWPVITYGVNYNGEKIGRGTKAEGFEQPVYYWDPSIAPGAVTVYRGTMFPEWQDDLLVTSLKFGLISRLDRDDTGKIIGEERFVDAEFGRLRDIVTAPDGSILVATDEAEGQLLRITRAGK
jgi:glucose/arabinose dehydrogenase